ncbi:hypothetical protein LI328DRAFT_139865 [Trichoderma asperelloides]|nr:hypothetical protein LI328DRAFT_139865 [Trichoderma asperelloides]
MPSRACFASLLCFSSAVIWAVLNRARRRQRERDRDGEEGYRGSGVITQRPIIEIPNKGPRCCMYVLEIQKCRYFSSDYALHVRSGLMICANIRLPPSYHTSTLRRGRQVAKHALHTRRWNAAKTPIHLTA